jgi:hypothetical protein
MFNLHRRQDFSYGIYMGELDGPDFIYVNRGPSMSREAIDVYTEMMLKEVTQRIQNGHLFVINDATQGNIGMSPYTRKRTQEMIDNVATFPAGRQLYMASILPNPIVAQFLGTLVQVMNRHEAFVMRIFSETAKGYEWLQAQRERLANAG